MRTPTKKHPETSAVHAKIAAKIREKRLAMKMSQGDFARFMHVTQATVSVWESGRHNFSISLLMYICEKTGMNFVLEMREGRK